MSRIGRIRIGISGWRYKGWRGTFYPEKVHAPFDAQSLRRRVEEIATEDADQPHIHRVVEAPQRTKVRAIG